MGTADRDGPRVREHERRSAGRFAAGFAYRGGAAVARTLADAVGSGALDGGRSLVSGTCGGGHCAGCSFPPAGLGSCRRTGIRVGSGAL